MRTDRNPYEDVVTMKSLKYRFGFLPNCFLTINNGLGKILISKKFLCLD